MKAIRVRIGMLCGMALGSAVASGAPADRPCEQLRTACEDAGFAQGAVKMGSGLWIDCVLPIMRGQAQRPQATKPLPQVSPEIVSACRAKNPNFGSAPAQAAGGQPTPALPPGVHIQVDEAKLHAHVMLPPNVVGIESDTGIEEVIENGPIQIVHPGYEWTFDLAGFGEDVRDQLDTGFQGYSLEVRKGGKSVYSANHHWARTPADGSEEWTTDRIMHVASLSKMITAVLMTKLLDEKKISTDSTISRYLPTYWHQGKNVDKITFHELLTHKSGFDTKGTGSSDFQFMEKMVADGVTSIGTYKYENMNFGLCRILLAVIMGAIDRDAQVFPLGAFNDTLWDLVTTLAYVTYAAQYVFEPSGVEDFSLTHPAHGVLAYSFPKVGPGWNSGDLTSQAGGAGWHLTVKDMLNVMGTVRRAGTILSKDKAQDMFDAKFGIDGVQSTPIGKTYCKDGLWFKHDPVYSSFAEQSFACYLPQDMELVVLANSPKAPGTLTLAGIIVHTFQNHVVQKPVGQ